MSTIQSHPHLTLGQHLDQIRSACSAIRIRHSQLQHRECGEAWNWLEDSVRLHDTGKGSQQFQKYIRDPEGYLRRYARDTKSHTPLSLVITLALARRELWNPGRTFAVAQIVRGHHSGLDTAEDFIAGVHSSEVVLSQQIPTINWHALGQEVDWCLQSLQTLSAEELQDDAVDQLEILFAQVAKQADVRYRLLCQLAFSVLLEADKALLAIPEVDVLRYLGQRRESLSVTCVDRYLASKPAVSVNSVRERARREVLAGMTRLGTAGLQTLTLPTGTGKTLLAATWALHQRNARPQGDAPPLVIIVLPYLSIIDQTAKEYEGLFTELGLDPGELITYHSLADRTYDPDLEDSSQDFFLDTWQSSVVITTFDQFCLALFSQRGRHLMRFHHLTDAVIVLDEIQTLPTLLWEPLQAVLGELVRLGSTRVLAMSATQPGFLSTAQELTTDPEAFFRCMQRYRLVLRHHRAMRLSEFATECVNRTDDWQNQKVLLTFNTRRSAREVLKALPQLKQPVEFLTADVTPADRLAAVERIKKSKACLVVSTQCIEAGVDLDMDLVIRDFGPLDSLIQVAGRCNRNGERGKSGPWGREKRGTVEVVRLLEENTDKEFSSYVYDKVKREITEEVLRPMLARGEVWEEEVFELARCYFAGLWNNKDRGQDILKDWLSWQKAQNVRRLLRGPEMPRVHFVVTENDPTLEHALIQAYQIKDRWQRRRALRQLAARVARQTVSVAMPEKLDPSLYADPFPPGKTGDEVWFWFLRPGFYSPSRGVDLAFVEESVGWGVF